MLKEYLVEDYSSDLLNFLYSSIAKSTNLSVNISLTWFITRIKEPIDNKFFSIQFKFDEPISLSQVRSFREFITKVESRLINFKLSV